jgi:hypothetical protein
MTMKMVDMKNDRKKGQSRAGLEVSYHGDEYPYGLSISLMKDGIKKLKLESEDMVAGAMIDFCISCKVTSTRIEPGSKDITNMELQIMKMGEMPDEDD